MSTDLDRAIESLRTELQKMSRRFVEIKKAINQILAVQGLPAEFSDLEIDETAIGQFLPKSRQFLGKSILEAVTEYLRKSGRAASATEILDGLEKGDFEFPKDWKSKLRLKNLAIFLGSRKDDFVTFETKEGKAYGLVEQYPEKKRERERQQKEIGQPLSQEDVTKFYEEPQKK